MAGVSGPLMRRSHADGVRFLLGLAVGGAAAGSIVSLPVYLVGSALAAAVPERLRLLMLVAVCVGFGIADLVNRTPHVWRQVPQGFVRELSPGLRGLIWGFDLGLLVTTQKAASLVWVAICAMALVAPASAPALLVGMALVSSLSVTVWSFRPGALMIDHGGGRDRRWLRSIRALSGTVILIAGTATLLSL
jgi:hypothetical protein